MKPTTSAVESTTLNVQPTPANVQTTSAIKVSDTPPLFFLPATVYINF